VGGCLIGPSHLFLWSLNRGSNQRVVILKKQAPGLTALALSRFVTRACRAVPLHGTVNVLVTSSREMKVLNGRFRKKNKPTDVLSFPAVPNSVDKTVGDIAISAEIAASNAKQLGHSGVEEIKVLALHGILHLAGFDHEQDNGEMAREEGRLRSVLGLPTGLIERAGSAAGARRLRPSRKNSTNKNIRVTRKLR
jgi:probable rRNA maturation factor